MKTKLALLLCLLAAPLLSAADKPTVIPFKDLQTKLEANKDKTVAVLAGAELVSRAKGMFTITDPAEAGCGDGCAKPTLIAEVPKELQGQMPKVKDEVIVVGKLQMTERGYALAVTELVVGKEAVKRYGK